MGIALTLRHAPAVPVEAEQLTPQACLGAPAAAVAALALLHGNERTTVGEFFELDTTDDHALHLHGDLSRFKLIGAGMNAGRVCVHGNAGAHLGAGMSGGRIEVDGDAGDWIGPEMSGGLIVVRGNAGHMVGAALRGSPAGMQGGTIVVHGGAGNEVASGMRRGLVGIGGDTGDFAAVNMLAGSLVVCGRLGARPGAGMRRGTIVTLQPAEPLPTFTRACTYHPVAIRLLLLHLAALGLPLTDAQISARYQRFSGDAIELDRGELFMPAP